MPARGTHWKGGNFYMYEAFSNAVNAVNGIIAGPAVVVLVVCSGIYLSVRLGFFQLVHFKTDQTMENLVY